MTDTKSKLKIKVKRCNGECFRGLVLVDNKSIMW